MQNFSNSGAEEGATCRAALLSGPPGIGKTTIAHMVSQMEGYQILEFNASDTRNKISITVRIL